MTIKETDDTQEAVELLESIESQAVLVRQLQQKVEASRERLKDDRTELDEATTELTRLCLTRDESNPLFDEATGDTEE